MAVNLTGSTIASSYNQLLHIDAGPTTSAKVVYSGTGTGTALKVATTHIEVDNMRLDGNTISILDTDGNLTLTPNGTGSVVISKVAISAGTISGITDLAILDGGTGASTASGARTNLGLGTISTQDANNIAITGGSISGVTFTGSFTGLTLIGSTSFATSNAATNLTITTNGISAGGSDTNVDIVLSPKGTGSIVSTKVAFTGGSINGTTLGASTPASVTGTDVLATQNLGYTTGAGGTVTQLTSRTTGVTLNKICGQITLVASGISGHEADEFVLTNSTIGANDIVVVCIKSGAAAGTRKYYHTQVVEVTAGSCIISVGNMDNNSIGSESPVLSFAVIKGVIA
jgi:hypothetical protein